MKLTVAVVGLMASLVAFVVSFCPPTGLPGSEANTLYAGLLVVCFLIVLSIPFIIYALHDKRAKRSNITLKPVSSDSAPEGHFFIHPRARSMHHIFVDNKKVH